MSNENKITFEAAYVCRIAHTDLLGNERLYLLLAAGEDPNKLLITELDKDFVEVDPGAVRLQLLSTSLLDTANLVKSGGLPQAVADAWLQTARKDLTDIAGQMQSVIGSNEYPDADKSEAVYVLDVVEDALGQADLVEFKARYKAVGPVYQKVVIELRQRAADRAKQALFARSLAILNATEGATEADRKQLHEMCGVPYTAPDEPTPEPVETKDNDGFPPENENPINPLCDCTKVEAEVDCETGKVIYYDFSGGGKAEPCPIATFEGEGGGLGHVD